MHTVNVNGTASYQHCKQHEARQIVSAMSDTEKQRVLDTIKTHQGVNHLIGQRYDTKMLHYIERLLSEDTQ